MLTAPDRAIVKSTVPLLESGGEALITHFYQTLLNEYPQVRPLFNQAHQANGDQPRALANGVLMYARHIDQLDELGDLVAGSRDTFLLVIGLPVCHVTPKRFCKIWHF